MKLVFLFIGALSFSKALTQPQLVYSTYTIEIPQDRNLEVEPTELNTVNLNEFSKDVMPEILNLQFYSHRDQKFHPVLWSQINNYCYARRTAIDTYLWFGEPLKAQWSGRTGGGFKIEGTYVPNGFLNHDFQKRSWVETAKIQVIGKLNPGPSLSWNNHEAVVINTDQGIRVIDPSFDSSPLTIKEWFAHFAPEELNRECVRTDYKTLRNINQELIKTQQFKKDWDPSVPYCGYNFTQRLAASDMTTGTGFFSGSELEKFLSSKFFKYFEEDLLKDY